MQLTGTIKTNFDGMITTHTIILLILLISIRKTITGITFILAGLKL